MRIVFVFLILIACHKVSYGQDLNTPADSLSYSAGVMMAQNLKKQGFKNISTKILVQAIDDVIQNNTLSIDVQESDKIYKQEIVNLKKSMKEKALHEGEAFLAENAKKDGVVTLESGLQYEIITEGSGPSPSPASEVTTHYHGTLITGEVFDSSVERGQPLSFPLNRVIQAWQEALPLMKIGSKWRIFSPYQLAYGSRGAGAKIPPFAALIFEIELLEIQ